MCKSVQWVDREWPDALKKCLDKLWKMYELERSGRFSDACDAAERNYVLSVGKKELEQKIENLHSELSDTINQATINGNLVVGTAHKLLNSHKLLVQKAEKERDQLREEKKELEHYIAVLCKAGEVNNDKLRRMKEIMDE